jgi:hypothetical protein
LKSEMNKRKFLYVFTPVNRLRAGHSEINAPPPSLQMSYSTQIGLTTWLFGRLLYMYRNVTIY